MFELGISMPGLTTGARRFPDLAAQAEAGGFAAVWDYEFWRNPFTIHATTALSTSRIQLATGIASAFTRSPYSMACAAADIDELSNGRMILGIGAGTPEFLEAFHSTDASRRVGRMREYIDVVRLAWKHIVTQDPTLSYEGEHYRFTAPPFNPWGGRELVREQIPIYLGAMGPQMMRLAGEKADGWIGVMASPEAIENTVRPNIVIGAERAGRDPAEVRLTAETICCVHPDRDVAMRRARIHVGQYAANSLSDGPVAAVGLERDRDELRVALMQQGPEALNGVTSDALVEAFSITGTPAEARARLREFDGLLDHVILHPPYVPPLEASETEDAFAQIVDAFSEVASLV